MSETIIVKMLGGFSIEYNNSIVDDNANRMKKVWLLLAYLICSRNTRVTQENLQQLFTSAGSDDALDPNGKLKAMLYRARALLDGLEGIGGHDLIVRKNGSYGWNTDIPIRTDIDEFENLCRLAASIGSDGERLEKYLEAIKLYKGDFIPKLAHESWAMPVSVYYHRMYLEAVEQAVNLLEAAGKWEETAALCRKAVAIEPYGEAIYQHLMKSLIALGDRTEAQQVYEDMSEILFSNFGIMPSEESRQLYRTASRESETATVPVGTVRENLKESGEAEGALYCEYDFFKFLYQMQARAIVRSGEVIHIALFSVHGKRNKPLPRRSLDVAMDNLKDITVGNLRQGDVVSRCSVSQIIVMLPQANYENSCTVCDRIVRAFFRKYPHSPADIRFSVQPLEPKT